MASAETPWWQNLVTWVLVFAGWVVVHLASLSRERRKERRDVAQAAIEQLRDLEIQAVEFHTSPNFDAHRCDTLRSRTDRIIRRLQRPPMDALDIPIGRMVRLRKSISLRNVEPSDFSAQLVGSAILSDIRSATDDLIDSIEVARERCWT